MNWNENSSEYKEIEQICRSNANLLITFFFLTKHIVSMRTKQNYAGQSSIFNTDTHAFIDCNSVFFTGNIYFTQILY